MSPAFVLVSPQMGENIGMAARALLNAALEDLRLVSPRDGWPNAKALLAASGADKVIEGAQVFENLSQAVADCHAVYATTLRPRDMNKPVFTPRQAMTRIREQAAKGERAAILFGPERTGLWSDDVAAADAIITIPLNPNFSSMNLAQAVAILSYEWFQAGDDAVLAVPSQRSPRAKQDELRAFMAYLEKTLDQVGYFHPPEKRQVMWHNMQSLFARAELTEQELRTLFGVIKQLALEARPMSQAKGPRRFDHYPSALILFWEEEIGGIAFFRALSQGFAGRQKRALELMAEAEVITADLLRPLLDKYGLQAGDPKALTEGGIREAKALGQVSWAALLKRWQIGFPDFINEFEQIERLAPPEDLPRLKAVTAHEIAAVDFLNLELQGSADSLRPLEVFVETYAAGGPGRSALNSK